MEIRQCTHDDVQDLGSVFRKSYVENYTWLWDDLGVGYLQSNFSDEKLSAELSAPDSFYYLLYNDGQAVGAMKLNLDDHPEKYKRKHAIELERIYLVNAASGKGYGRSALEFAENFGRDRNKEFIWLKAMKYSKALMFYKKMGFIRIDSYFLDYPLMKKEFREIVVFEKIIEMR